MTKRLLVSGLPLLPAMLLIFFICCRPGETVKPGLTELRGVWITNVDSHVLDSQDSISSAMQFLADHHFNIVFPVVWNDSKTLFPSRVMDSLFGLPIDPRYAGRDPLAEVVEEAHKRNIAVIPWFEYGFAASHLKNGGMILEKEKNWAARDEEGQLLTKNGFEWMNGYHKEVQAFMHSLIMEAVMNYDVQGVQGDDRLPAQPVEGGYSDYTINLYLSQHNGQFPPLDFHDADWKRWRADILNTFAEIVYRDVKKWKAEAQVSWAPSLYPWSYNEYLQDWPAWVRQNHADLIHPQVYRYDLQSYKAALDSQNPDSVHIPPVKDRIFPGILMNVGDYIMEADYLMGALQYNRDNGYNGEVFFFYEGLRKNGGFLADTLLATFYKEPTRLPFRWRNASGLHNP